MSNLNLKQDAFCQLIATPDSTTFDNGTRAYQQAYGTPEEHIQTARVQASRLLTKPSIRNRIEQLLTKAGYGEQVRMDMLSTIGRGAYIKKTICTRYEPDGKTVKDVQVTESGTSADSIIRANDVINRLTGKYELARQASRTASKLYKSMVDSVTSQGTAQQHKSASKRVKGEGRGD